MSLVGFEHAFSRASLLQFGQDMQWRVAPLSVLALLKIISYMDDPNGRQKDLTDLRVLFRLYEADSERLFGDKVFSADLEDIEYANAFLLGIDVGGFATQEEREIVNTFLADHLIPDEELAELHPDDVQRNGPQFQHQLRAFQMGLDCDRT